MHLKEGVVDRSVEEGARILALALGGECGAAAKRLQGSGDAEAVHDFRVTLRRLRTILRAFEPWLKGSIRPKTRKRLSKLARGTNDARDARVQLDFLTREATALGARQRAGLDFLRGRFEARRSAGEARAGRLASEYRRLFGKLAKRLDTYEAHIATEPSAPFGAVLAALVREQLVEMRERLEALSNARDEEHVHRARIAAKRLRYLLEPLRGNRHAEAQTEVKRLKQLQSLLGDLHDAHVMSHEIASVFVDAAAERARQVHAALSEGAQARGARVPAPRTGVLAVEHLLRERRDALFAEVQREWRGGGLDVLSLEISGIIEALESRAGGRIETEHEYLLTSLPPRAEAQPAVEIEQGWIPGEQLRERVRRMRAPDGEERFWRTLKYGAGRQWLEAEEQTTHEIFEGLWALTEGRRVRKHRYTVRDADVIWKIDRFSDRELVLAEVELPPGAPDVSPPDWLSPFVVREVTGEPAYLNEALALGAAGDGEATKEAGHEPSEAESPGPGAAGIPESTR